MKKTILIGLPAGLMVLAGGCRQADRKQDLPPPNILWITSEDNSPFIGAYGDEFATTPVLDSLAATGILYENAFAAAPVCAPTRSTIITGMYANSMGTEQMRSHYPIPEFIRFYPHYLKEAGYYCTNNAKKDYNTVDQPEAWHESSNEATYRNRKPGQPFFHIRNLGVSHESSIHKSVAWENLRHDPEQVPIPPYHPRTREMKHDWAQYYDKVQDLDSQIGEILRQLREDGLADSTIVFYYSDHGGVLGRSKRFLFESGLRVPLIISFPEMYRHLAPGEPGTRTDRIVSFVDFAPTLLSLAGVKIPENMQGKAFLGPQQASPGEYSYSFRGRMDERIDLSRSVRDNKYRYTRNYMPHKKYGQYIAYLWRAPSMRSWEREWKAGNLDEVQSRFWGPKAAEELYEVHADPHNVHNLAGDESYGSKLEEMREANRELIMEIRDAGFIPEAMMAEISEKTTLWEFARSEQYPLEEILEVAEKATIRDSQYKDFIIEKLDHENAIVRYWAVTGCIVSPEMLSDQKEKLVEMTGDPEIAVVITAAEALYHMGETEKALEVLIRSLDSENLMARVQALNVLETMGEDAFPAMDKVRSMVRGERQRGYDIRAAEHLVEKFN